MQVVMPENRISYPFLEFVHSSKEVKPYEVVQVDLIPWSYQGPAVGECRLLRITTHECK